MRDEVYTLNYGILFHSLVWRSNEFSGTSLCLRCQIVANACFLRTVATKLLPVFAFAFLLSFPKVCIVCQVGKQNEIISLLLLLPLSPATKHNSESEYSEIQRQLCAGNIYLIYLASETGKWISVAYVLPMSSSCMFHSVSHCAPSYAFLLPPSVRIKLRTCAAVS